MLTKKNIVIIHSNGYGMCALLRGGALADLSQSLMTGEFEFIESPEIINDEYILKHTAAVIICRLWREDQQYMVRHYDKYRRRSDYGLKVFLEYDDLMWDLDGKQCIPVFNPAPINSAYAGKSIEEIADKIDGTFVTNEWLKACWEYRFNRTATIIPNFLPLHLYGERIHRIDEKIRKPVVLYGGSPYHFKKGMEGDFAGPWIPWIKYAVTHDLIEMHMFGRVGWMFEDVAHKIVMEPSAPSILWPMRIRDIAPDIYIGPLVDHPFNRAKSNLKYSEACAIGAAFVGSYWEQFCPYDGQFELCRVTADTTPEQLQEKVEKICEPETYNRIMEHQHEFISHMWLESSGNLTYVLKCILGDALEVTGHGQVPASTSRS